MNSMRLKVLLPEGVLLDEPAEKVVGEARNGSFCLLPRHRDFASALVPGLLQYTSNTEGERFVAVDEGLIVKTGFDVLIATRHAILASDLGSARDAVVESFAQWDDRERSARSAMVKLEADFVRRFLELGEHAHGG